jgi:hypothetical protein
MNETYQITSEEKKKRGRPKKVITDIQPENVEKSKGGRPRKYDINDPILMKQVKTEQNKKYYETRGYYTNKIKYYMNRYNLNITQETYSEKPVEELKDILIKIETKINEIRLKNIEDKMKNKQEEMIKQKEERIKVKEDKLLQKLKDQQTKKEEIMNKKIENMKQKEEHKIHDKQTEKEFKPKQIKMKHN